MSLFKIFDRSKGLKSSFKAPLYAQPILSLKEENELLKNEVRILKEQYSAAKEQLAQRKVYAGQKFYNPDNHKAPTIYLCARWNEWYVVRAQNEVTPRMITSKEFETLYGSYVVMPRQNFNRKHIW